MRLADPLAPLCIALALAGCRSETGAAAGSIEVGEPAPAYAAANLAGDTITLADLHGSAVLLNVWATWCGPCREEMPELQAIAGDYPANALRVVAVSIDRRCPFACGYRRVRRQPRVPDQPVASPVHSDMAYRTFLLDASG
jgi:thiol-disulfide isomerase/thioredoxin